MLASSPVLIDGVARKVSKEMGLDVGGKEVIGIIQELFDGIVLKGGSDFAGLGEQDRAMASFAVAQKASNELADSSRLRTRLSSDLVKRAINATSVVPHPTIPVLSTARLADGARLQVEVLKQSVYMAIVSTPRVKMQECGGTIVVKGLFAALAGDRGDMLMPDDVRERHHAADIPAKMNVVSDFIAGMTDRYAVEFYDRLQLPFALRGEDCMKFA